MIRLAIILAVTGLTALQAFATDLSCANAGAIGTSRVIEIDTTGGPQFGEQYPPSGLLQPGEVALTFDDGPHPKVTPDILATLDAQCVKATFFYVGRMAKEFPDVLRAVHAKGHTIGAHTWTHRNLGHASREQGINQIETTFAELDRTLPNQVAPFFRFPYLSDNKQVLAYLKTRDVATFSIDVDSLDWRYRTPDRVLRNVMNGLAKTHGGIILFHDIHANTARTLPAILEALKAANYKIVHLVAKAPVKAQPVATPVAEQRKRQPRRKSTRLRPTAPEPFF